MSVDKERSEARRRAAEAFYGALAQSSDAARRVGWESGAAHLLRLRSLAEALAPLSEVRSILDVGCGEGALLPVLRAAGFAGSYRGEDVLARPIERARAAHAADGAAAFAVCDGFALEGPRAEAVVCSGTLNTLSGASEHDAEVAAALAAMWRRTEAMLVVDVAVRDRHADGVGLGRADLGRAWQAARALTPVVVVREDVVAGEALLILARGRGRAYARWLPGREGALARGEALLQGGAPEEALAATDGLEERAEVLSLRGRALAARGEAAAGLALLERAVAAASAEDNDRLVERVQLAMAPCLWRLGQKRAAEALLERLAETSDEARAHLFELVMARRDVERARAIVGRITDAWMKRELEARLPPP